MRAAPATIRSSRVPKYHQPTISQGIRIVMQLPHVFV